MRPIADVDEALWGRVLDVNLNGALLFAHAAARHMVKAGSIVNIASIDALHPAGALTAYDAFKGGMLMLTRSLAVDLGKHKIRVNAICTGSIKTPGVETMAAAPMKGMTLTAEQMVAAFTQRIPLARMGEPHDTARAAPSRASPTSAYMTGDVMVVDGGSLLS